jgi:hypothetical protein
VDGGDGLDEYGYEGDPDNDGVYSYTHGYNLANSEMGHLFYTELDNIGYRNTNGSYNTFNPPGPGYLQNTGDFDNLLGSWYWSGTEHAVNLDHAWFFSTYMGHQNPVAKDFDWPFYGLAVHSGNVSVAPVPEPSTILLVATGLLGLAGFRAIERTRQAWWNYVEFMAEQ